MPKLHVLGYTYYMPVLTMAARATYFMPMLTMPTLTTHLRMSSMSSAVLVRM